MKKQYREGTQGWEINYIGEIIMTIEEWQELHPGGNELNAEWFDCLPDETQFAFYDAMYYDMRKNSDYYFDYYAENEPDICASVVDFDVDESGNMIEMEDAEE